MISIKFKEQTGTLKRPASMTDKECSSLPIYKADPHIISCWKMSLWERVRAVLFGKVWLWVWSNSSQPPVALDCRRSAFKKAKRNPRGSYLHFWNSIRKK